MDISEDIQQRCDFVARILQDNPRINVMTMADDYSIDTVIKSMRAGAKDFLPKPIKEQEFSAVIGKFFEYNNVIKHNNCKVITLFSNKGGIGKTSIAVNLALELANITKEKVALIDMNFQLGDVINFLDIKPSFNIAYVFDNLNNANEEFFLATFDKYKNTNLYVLADSPYLEQSKNITTNQIFTLFEKLRKTFSYVIIDTSNIFDDKTIPILDNTDFIMLVSVLNLPALRNCQRCLDVFDRLGYDKDKTKIVVNRYIENDDISIDDAEKTLNRKIYWKIPNNYFTLISAINKGLPVYDINPHSNLAKSYRELATVLSDNLYKQKLADRIIRNKKFSFKNLILS